MQDAQKIRFLAANYSNLQGLKAVPLGLLMLLVVYWANAQRGPARGSLVIPVLLGLGAAGLYTWIDHYYKTHYGQVVSTPQQKRAEVIFGVAGGVIALAAFIADMTLELPLSLIGLIFAGAFIFEYLRVSRQRKSTYLFAQMLAGFVIVLAVNLLPLLGLSGWWAAIGMRSHFLAVLAVAGVVMLASGLSGHLYLSRQLPALEA
ncbi:MAG: hypothetical protein EHM70_12030 [Chloroflexota bacterium]|nr:MAG: hypothetical protein EHM70_12030 [Chloroflexota bacterium]